MLRFLAASYAKLAYRFKLEKDAAHADLNAALSARLAAEKRSLMEQLNYDADLLDKQAEDIDKRIQEVAAMEAAGFWQCECGSESPDAVAAGTARYCENCGDQMKILRRDLMSEQEKNESDNERREVENIARSKREEAKAKRTQASAESKSAEESQKTAHHFRAQATNGRSAADKLRNIKPSESN